MEFADSDSIKRVFKSTEYKALIPDCEKAFVSLSIFISKT